MPKGCVFTMMLPRNPGCLKQQTLKTAFRAVVGHFFYSFLEIYINEEPVQKIGSPVFIFWSGGPLELSYLELSDSLQLWQNLDFAEIFFKSLSNLNQNY